MTSYLRFHSGHRAVAKIMSMSNVMVVHPTFAANTVTEFIAYAKANPDKLNMASAATVTKLI